MGHKFQPPYHICKSEKIGYVINAYIIKTLRLVVVILPTKNMYIEQKNVDFHRYVVGINHSYRSRVHEK